MSALDQAFVRAYGHPVAAEADSPVEPSPAMRREPSDASRVAPFEEEEVPAETLARAPQVASASAEAADTVRSKPTRAGKHRVASSRKKRASAKAGRAPRGEATKSGGRFRPLLEVDAYLWPKTIHNLAVAAAEGLEELCGSVLDGTQRNQKVIGWQGCRRGDGCSTLLLAVARRLAEQGLKVAVVDADIAHPRLARRLGLSPSVGWEEAAAGRVPLAEVVVESLRDGVVLVPWCGPTEITEPSAEGPFDPAPVLEPLRRTYDLVLVDLGPHGQEDGDAATLASLRACLDRVLVVHHVGEVQAKELTRVCRRLTKSGKARLAIVENFV